MKIVGRVVAPLLLAAPLIGLAAWAWIAAAGYGTPEFVEASLASLALAGLLMLSARWRLLGAASWPVAWVLYLLALVATLAEAMSFYFQNESFNVRFFANLQWGSLRSGFDAFPTLFGSSGVLLAAMLALSIWVLRRAARLRARDEFLHGIFKAGTVLILLAATCVLPWSGKRLAGFFVDYSRSQGLADTVRGGEIAERINFHPMPRGELRALPGRNLVIIYMESLERIYTDEKIFPGLTPNLNRYRASGLDYSGYLTFSGASYTIAGIFASQCGVPLIVSPWNSLNFGGNDNNDSTFQPGLVCFGDVLHVAHYTQAFMNGSPLSFADQGAFFRMHGFDQVLGFDELEHAADGKLPQAQWGLYDRDLFALAAKKFDTLAAAGRPFNLDILTIDNHPPHGRPSPGCPRYAGSDNDVLQAVHCTDFLVGRFLDEIRRNPAWKNTVVAVMSDHQSLPNDAWPLYPKTYRRRPLLFVLNAGKGERAMRFYHMDIAPTLLDLMHVSSNASFIAGADRSAADAPASPLLNDATDLAVLRQAVWAHAPAVVLCRKGVLLDSGNDGFRIAGRDVPLSKGGESLAGLSSDEVLAFFIGHDSLRSAVLPQSLLDGVLAQRGSTSVLLIQPHADAPPAKLFSIDWLGRKGAHVHLGDVPRLAGLKIESPQCARSLAQADGARADAQLDFSDRFVAQTDSLYPSLPAKVDFGSAAQVRPLQREFGWLPAESWGSFTIGDTASLGFSLPPAQCHRAFLRFDASPFLKPSRPKLDVRVLANGKLMNTWHFALPVEGSREVEATIETADPECHVDLRFEFLRSGAAPPPYPPAEDPRPLQLLFRGLQQLPVAASTLPATAH